MQNCCLSLQRESGLKYGSLGLADRYVSLSLQRESGLKYEQSNILKCQKSLSLQRESGLKYAQNTTMLNGFNGSLPAEGEWIEIVSA